ncbi:hypothetical protein [Spirosoma sp. KUDC1026]|uniref:hypothetical protein n=1 Tax=Spirosoma sp. KUDC1026 TaxID=2745947 RepID=UPI00159BAA01|nr:hypothetical protein [Spirosoma sp. KUDC1026]QKZ15201.1 hypothetical protein HU175_22270 [Spirosoma sp. KUDC1026]
MAFTPDASFTYQGHEAAELTLRPAVDRPALSKYFAITEGLKGRLIVQFLERVGLITTVDPGCGLGATTRNTRKTNKTFAPVDLKAWYQECWKVLRGQAEEWYLNAGNDKKNLGDTVYGDYCIDMLEYAIYEDLLRMAWFADRNMTEAKLTASYAAASGDTLTAAQLVPYFKTFNGAWRNVELGIAAQLTKLVPIAANNPTGDQVLDPNDVPAIFQAMFSAADPRLYSQPTANKLFMVSHSIFDAWTIYRESKNLDLAYVAQADGVSLPTFRGVPIMVVPEWDEFLGGYFKKAGKIDRPHRALLTVKGNLQLRFDATPVDDSGSAGLEVWSSQDTELWNARQTYAADMQIADDALVVAAY